MNMTHPDILCAEANGYGPGFEEEEEREPKQFEMVEYSVPVTLTVLVPKQFHSDYPKTFREIGEEYEKARARTAIENFLRLAHRDNDRVTRKRMESLAEESDTALNLDDFEYDEPFEIDTKYLYQTIGEPERQETPRLEMREEHKGN